MLTSVVHRCAQPVHSRNNVRPGLARSRWLARLIQPANIPQWGRRTWPMAMDVQPGTRGFDAQQIWQLAQEELRFQLTRLGYEMWMRRAVLVECEDGRIFTIGVPTRLARDWLTERY